MRPALLAGLAMAATLLTGCDEIADWRRQGTLGGVTTCMERNQPLLSTSAPDRERLRALCSRSQEREVVEADRISARGEFICNIMGTTRERTSDFAAMLRTPVDFHNVLTRASIAVTWRPTSDGPARVVMSRPSSLWLEPGSSQEVRFSFSQEFECPVAEGQWSWDMRMVHGVSLRMR